ncbi:MAG: hypothetical protein EXS50_01850 [Candidatus Taylorbacteria bacterium]|nr:hypothetical protein [Candidatus Taylorbacteria bacterium]
MNEDLFPKVIIMGAVLLIYGFFLAHPIDLVTADLGRHIENGKMMFENSAVLSTNFYSYTTPDFSVVNHHWGSGLILFLVWKLFGFVGVHLFFILVSLAALFVFFWHGKRCAGWGVAGIVTLLSIWLLGERTEIRPEVVSYFFAGLFFLLLSKFRDDPKNIRIFWALPLIGVFWVNSHIYFILGLLIIGAYLLESLLVKREQFIPLLKIFGATIVAMIINPYGIYAFTAVFTIFNNYGYRLAENQPVWFMEKIMADPAFFIFKIIFALLVISFVWAFWKDRKKVALSNLFIAIGLSIMGWFAVRNIALFGLFAIPIICANAAIIFSSLCENKVLLRINAIFVGVGLLVTILFTIPQHFPYWRSFGFGVEAGNDASIKFLQENNIKGPIFNNYDIGGYLIFHLYPQEKVFVDNRPEAYPTSFFQEVYIPMQEDNKIWQRKFNQYKFNSIVFSYHDATPWGQTFLLNRINDPDWAPVFVDNKVLIFLRRTKENSVVIKKFELPKSIFSHA